MDFIRRAELIVGPLAEWKGGGPQGNALRVVADGSLENFRMAFSVSKTITGDPNKISVAIWGLSLQTRQQIRAGLTRILLRGGYENGAHGVTNIASGSLLSSTTTGKAPDIVQSLQAFDGYGGMVRGAYTRAFEGGTPVTAVVREIAQGMPGVIIGRVDVAGTLYAKGQHFSGSCTAQLNRLADQYGFSWSIQDGVFQALDDKKDSGSTFTFTSGYNLLNVSPVLNGPLQVPIGIQVQATFEARVKPGDSIIVQSVIDPSLSGRYKATSVDLRYDSHGPAGTTVKCLKWF